MEFSFGKPAEVQIRDKNGALIMRLTGLTDISTNMAVNYDSMKKIDLQVSGRELEIFKENDWKMDPKTADNFNKQVIEMLNETKDKFCKVY